MPSVEKTAKKSHYLDKLAELVQLYPHVLVVHADHVGSKQMADVRFALREKGILLMGKNTMIRTALKRVQVNVPQLEKLISCVKMNIGFVFCIVDPSEVRKIILDIRVPAPAKQGIIAPSDVFVLAGPTGMDPGSTSFFQAMGISTKIVKAQIEIQNDVHIIKKGDKVSASASTLLHKLNVRPFSYGLVVKQIYDDGSVYDATVLDMSDEDVIKKFHSGCQNVAAICREIGIPSEASISHSIIEAFKFCTALVIDSDFTFKQMEPMKKYLENPSAFAQPTASTAAAVSSKSAAAAKVEEKEEEEEEDDDMGFSLFG